MKTQELIEKLKEFKITPEVIDYCNGFPKDLNELKEAFDIYKINKINENNITEEDLKDFGEVTVVDQYGGMGMGDNHYYVLYFEKFNIYLKIQGSYTSYEGSDYSYAEFFEVFPEQETITVYKSI